MPFWWMEEITPVLQHPPEIGQGGAGALARL